MRRAGRGDTNISKLDSAFESIQAFLFVIDLSSKRDERQCQVMAVEMEGVMQIGKCFRAVNARAMKFAQTRR